MRRTVLDSATKEALRKTVRALRTHLLDSLEQAAESEYRLHTTRDKAKLPADRHARRERLEAWMDEQVRATPAPERKTKAAEKALRERFRCDAIKEAAYTILNRAFFLRTIEHHGLIKPALISGGWESPAYRDEFVHYSQALQGDDTRGYAALLEMLYAEFALDLPGLFGPVGLTQLFPVPAASLRQVIEELNDAALDRAWGDDMTLGWVYQFWNDPERESLDAKISGGGKIERREIAPKTQMFTERYMVEWLLQNSLGQTWLAVCEKNGWTPDFHQVRDGLEARRAEWRQRREAGEVALDALMPLESELEELADLVDWHRRDAKPGWHEYFRIREFRDAMTRTACAAPASSASRAPCNLAAFPSRSPSASRSRPAALSNPRRRVIAENLRWHVPRTERMLRRPMTSLSPPIQAVLDLFKGPLANLRFADVDAVGLAALAADVEAAAGEVEEQENKLTELRQSLAQRQEALLILAQRALAYARVYAEHDEPLLGELNRIALPRPAKPRKAGAPKVSSPRDVARNELGSESALLPGADAEGDVPADAEAVSEEEAGSGERAGSEERAGGTRVSEVVAADEPREPAPTRAGRKGRGAAAQRAAS